MKDQDKYVIFKENPIGDMTDYDKYSKLKDKKNYYKRFYYGKATMGFYV